MPKRINKAVELLEQGQPIYYTGAHSGAVLSHEAGKEMAGTWADYINVGMEHGSFDMAGLDQFMRGLVDGGPTASGHRTPTVVVELPTDGGSEQTIRYNAWQIRQILARGVHGLLLCHAETPGAVKAFVESARFPFNKIGVGRGLGEGRRGGGGQGGAAQIWGVSVDEYNDKADPWPLNPQGELMLGLKIENRRALENVEVTTRVPGIAFAEWGPGDMSMSYGYKRFPGEPLPPELKEARERVKAACDAAGIFFLEGATQENIARKIDEGVMVISAAGSGEAAARAGRAHTKRAMPV
ncbi:MAG: aldolase/citrate lyase family protein [Chloroflexi bacterium]|nr:aldolase/citrate lyase family protein [Chloroflexota bacterium]